MYICIYKLKTRMPAVSPPPEGSTTDLPCFFFEICFSLWFRSDSLSVSPEPELQTHCVFQGFLFFFSNVLFFSMQTKGFFKVRKKKSLFFGSHAVDRYIYTHIYISIYLYPCACTSNAQYCDFNARQRQHVE